MKREKGINFLKLLYDFVNVLMFVFFCDFVNRLCACVKRSSDFVTLSIANFDSPTLIFRTYINSIFMELQHDYVQPKTKK